jgi:uncharacterized protein YcaQ
MTAPRRHAASVTADRAAAFRLARHHLADRSAQRASVAEICGDTGGVQAQVASAAELAIWTRRRETSREDIRTSLWETRDIVRTSAMRMTLHIVPSCDLPVYIAALRTTAWRRIEYWLGRMGATMPQLRTMVAAIVDALEDGAPRTQQELIAAAKKRVGRRGVGEWLEHSWSGVRPAVIEGAIVYGPPRGAEATFVRTDAWLRPAREVDEKQAQADLLRRFLRAFGPATPHDFARWSGLRTSDARQLVDAAGDELAPVSVDGASGWVLRADLDALERSELDRDAVTLLGAFDSFLLAHATKEHLVEPRFYKRVYRPQGWISPVVLRGGAIIGVWFAERVGRTSTLRVDLFRRPASAVRAAIAAEADALGRFLGTAFAVRIK